MSRRLILMGLAVAATLGHAGVYSQPSGDFAPDPYKRESRSKGEKARNRKNLWR